MNCDVVYKSRKPLDGVRGTGGGVPAAVRRSSAGGTKPGANLPSYAELFHLRATDVRSLDCCDGVMEQDLRDASSAGGLVVTWGHGVSGSRCWEMRENACELAPRLDGEGKGCDRFRSDPFPI